MVISTDLKVGLPGETADKPAPQLVVIAGEGRVALVNRPDGSLGLPTLPGWDGEPNSLNVAISRQATQAALPAALLAGATQLTPLTWGGDDTPKVVLVEPWGAERPDSEPTGAGWWLPGTAPPPDLAHAAQPAFLAATAAAAAANDAWPFFSLPGATAALRELLASEESLRPFAALRTQPNGQRESSDLTQEQGWPLSSVWLNEETALKFTNPGWPHEGRITALLAEIAPAAVPEVIAHGVVTPHSSAPTAYLLQRRVTEPADPATEEASIARELATLQTLAELQLAARGHEQRLRAAGMADRGPLQTRRELGRLWEVVDPDLNEAERAALPGLAARVEEGLERLARTATLVVHGDLHLGNVLGDHGARPQIIDWTDAAFAWPGVDLFMIVGPKRDDESRERLTAAYVEALGGEFEEAVRLGADLASVYHALSYLRIADFMPSGLGIFGGAVVGWVKHQMKVFADG